MGKRKPATMRRDSAKTRQLSPSDSEPLNCILRADSKKAPTKWLLPLRRWVLLVALVSLTIWFGHGAVVAYRDSCDPTKGGMIPVYAGHRDREVVGEEYASGRRYQASRRRDCYETGILAIVAGIGAGELLRHWRKLTESPQEI